MLREYYYKNLLHQRLKYLENWLQGADTYRLCMNVYKRVEIELFRERPVFYMIIFIYFLPVNILKFVDNIKRNYYYTKTNKEIEIIKKEIEILKLTKKGRFYYGKKLIDYKK